MQDEPLPFPSCRPKSLVLQAPRQGSLPGNWVTSPPPTPTSTPRELSQPQEGTWRLMGFILGLRSLGTSHPPPAAGWRRGEGEEERGWGGGGLGEGAYISGSHSPASLTYIPLCPSLSICLSASFLLWLSTPPPHVCLLLSGQDSRPLGFGTQVPLPEGGNKDPWTNQEDSQGAGRGRRGWHWQGARDEHESQLPTALLIFPPSFEAPFCFCCLALVPKKHLGEVELVKSRPQVLSSCPGHSCCLGLLKPSSGHTLCYLYCCN